MISAQIAADELLRDLNLQNIKFKDKQRIAKNILDHFRQVIIVEFLHNLTERELVRFKEVLDADNAVEKVSAVAAQMPGLADQIERRVNQEISIIKAVMKLKPKN
ncbi:MAG: hypothetical protein A3J48_00500 [Candidatus Doudnabacteria bacterium RIFCSPHIGHO2_02_FULL_46_11]|uniref:Uncharacterized protein n=1 Tax=Candidatus Doudnabacteria bacterium RIFCSPHIGHO2_02_FULL_46_11 TaxID=1817832 RepID=A0A1F5P522_9BACT|nr:MAG: hypothetical protein A3J48_00500 [Candidatus Doudnabacteria bacterium RIFCSPHIGHO2_02_FULL_46_11]